MKKTIVLTLISISSYSFSQTTETKCSISQISQGVIEAKYQGKNRILGGSSEKGIGQSAIMNIEYTGTPFLKIQGASLISKSNGNPVQTNRIETSLSFLNSVNNSTAINSGLNQINGGNLKQIQLSNKNNQKMNDTVTISILSYPSENIKPGNYTTNMQISCN